MNLSLVADNFTRGQHYSGGDNQLVIGSGGRRPVVSASRTANHVGEVKLSLGVHVGTIF